VKPSSLLLTQKHGNRQIYLFSSNNAPCIHTILDNFLICGADACPDNILITPGCFGILFALPKEQYSPRFGKTVVLYKNWVKHWEYK
jgi:hypothetical protein